eukprot:7383359-Prymnesium_polylepis.1
MPEDDIDDLDELWSEAIPTAAQLAAERAAQSRGAGSSRKRQAAPRESVTQNGRSDHASGQAATRRLQRRRGPTNAVEGMRLDETV